MWFRMIGRAALVLLAGASALAATPPEPSLSFAALEAAHAEPGSRFVDVAGVRLHYVDEGRGPPLILLNASYLNLSSWQAVASRLKAQHRVIRLDFPTVGLSRAASEQALDIKAFEGQVLGLMDRLKINKATLVGTSSGAIVGFRLAAAHPERFDRLVLLNAAGLPRTAATDPLRERQRAADAPAPGSLDFWRQSLSDNFADPSRLQEAFVAQVHDWSRRDGIKADARTFMKGFATGDPQTVLGRITMPTLILWGEKGVTLSHLEAEVFAQWLVQAPAMVRKYADAGHYPQVEQPDRVAADIAAFMAGRLDPQLRPAPGFAAARLEDVPFWRANAGLWLGENVYLTATGERKIDGYANLTETRLVDDIMEEEEFRFYAASEMASTMAGGQLRSGEGVELRRVQKGRMADASGRVVMLADYPGAKADTVVTLQPFARGVGMLSVASGAGGPHLYRTHIDVTAPDRRIRTTLGLADGAPGDLPPGSLRAVALFREARQSPAARASLLTALRARFNVAVLIETGVDGKPIVRRLGNPEVFESVR
jgi:pimeloyl-ACP methyl ester carboxylesterase